MKEWTAAYLEHSKPQSVHGGSEFPLGDTLCSAVIRVAADCGFRRPTMRMPPLPQASIRGASHPKSTARGRAHLPPIDSGIQTSRPSLIPSEDPAHQDLTCCEDVPDCNESSTHAKSNGDVLLTAESPNRGTRDVPFRSRAHRANSPLDSRMAI